VGNRQNIAELDKSFIISKILLIFLKIGIKHKKRAIPYEMTLEFLLITISGLKKLRIETDYHEIITV
jgi:hypothetical protein